MFRVSPSDFFHARVFKTPAAIKKKLCAVQKLAKTSESKKYEVYLEIPNAALPGFQAGARRGTSQFYDDW